MADEVIVNIEDSIEDETEEIDELLVTLNKHNQLSEDRHREILERVAECQQRVETALSTGQAENPVLTQVLSQLTEMRSELTNLKSSMDSMSKDRPSIELTPEPTLEPVVLEEQNLEDLTDVQEPEENQPEPIRSRRKTF